MTLMFPIWKDLLWRIIDEIMVPFPGQRPVQQTTAFVWVVPTALVLDAVV